MPFTDADNGSAYLTLTGGTFGSDLMQLLETEAIDPGSDPGYQACKTIYTNHPLGARIVDGPLHMAMSQQRVLEVPGGPEEELTKAFRKEWGLIGKIGADNIIFRITQLSQIYGIATLGVNGMEKNGDPLPTGDPLPRDRLWDMDLYFNLFDPLNTAGSLVLNQDPYAVDFMHPKQVMVGAQVWNNTKTLVMMHEQPIWIKWTDSAFGFVGRSVYQRAFYPLKSFLISMLADQMVQEKLGLLVWKAKSPGAIVDMAARAFKQMQRSSIKGARTNQVVSIGHDDSLESLDMQHVEGAGKYSRDNLLKNIATATGRPASFLNQDTLVKGFGEGSEDAKQIARFIDRLRIEMDPAYRFMDDIVQRRAWNPTFFTDIQKRYPEQYGSLKYEAALHEWQDAWTATWPNLLTEPDSEKAKAAEIKLKSAKDIAELLMKSADPENKARIAEWLAQVVNDQKDFYSSPLDLDLDAMAAYVPPIGPHEAED